MVISEPGPLAMRSAWINAAFIFSFVIDGFVCPREGEGREEGKGRG
jgi:hypothetical protein